MLQPDVRALLTGHLRPDPGQHLIAAVATTFTLDLAAALAIPLSFAARDISESVDPVEIMHSVRTAADKVTVFFQSGMVKVPKQGSQLFAYLEQMVVPVTAPRRGLFHPKVWLLRYDGESGVQLRFLCLSRNLTVDKSWDLALRLDGVLGSKNPGNVPLQRFFEALPGMCVGEISPERRAQVMGLAEDARRTQWTPPEHIKSLAFHPLGLPGRRASLGVEDYGYRRLVISPFVTDGGLERTALDAKDGSIVISRAEELERLSPDTISRIGETLILPDSAGFPVDPDSDAGVLTNLHAKLFVVERNRNAHLYLGSANATEPALDLNVEMVVELVGGASKVGIDVILNSADGGLRSVLEPYEPTGGTEAPEEEKIGFALERLICSLAAKPWTAQAHPEDDLHVIEMTSQTQAPTDGVRVTVAPLTFPARVHVLEAGAPVTARFTGLSTVELTPFFEVTATHPDGIVRSGVILAQLLGGPAERLDEILAAQMDTPEKFLRLLALLLGVEGAALLAPEAHSDSAGGVWATGAGGGILELLVTALADNPASLVELGRVVERLQSTSAGTSVLPPGFAELWHAVTQAEHLVASR